MKLTPEGKVKVLDFGLAKAFAGDTTGAKEASPGKDGDYPDSQTLTLAPQLTASPTIPGVILGTAAYMSPEQAKGRTADKRTDTRVLCYRNCSPASRPARGMTSLRFCRRC